MIDQNVESLPQVQAVTGEISELEQFAASYQITTDVEYTAGAADLQRVKAAQKRLEETRTAITGPMNAALKRVNEFFRAPADKLVTVERTIKSRLVAYADEQERQRREAQLKADEAARKEREKLEAQAAKAAAAGKTEKAEQLEVRAATVVAPVVNREPPKIAGITTREVWKFEITDPAQVPREYLVVDEARVRKVVQALKGDTRIAGVRVYSERALAAGAA